MEKCINFPIDFDSKIPEWLGLPKIENNLCEGVVIKPNEPKFLWSGSRVILKNKNEAFKEISGHKDGFLPKENIKLSDNGNKLLEEILTYITENRLRNVLSHIGAVTDKDFGKIMGLMNKDIIEDFLKNNDEEFNNLDKKERKFIQKRMGSETSQLLRKNFFLNNYQFCHP